MVNFCYNKNNPLVRFILDYNIISSNQLNKVMTLLKGNNITNTPFFQTQYNIQTDNFLGALQRTLYQILQSDPKSKFFKDWFLTTPNTNLFGENEQELTSKLNQISQTLDFATRHKEYFDYTKHANELQQQILNGNITINTIKELCNELLTNISIVVDDCFLLASKNRAHRNPKMQKLIELASQCEANSLNRLDFYKKVKQSENINFSDIVYLALNRLQNNVTATLDPNQRDFLQKDLDLLTSHLDAFMIMIAPQLKKQEGVIIRPTSLDKFKLNSLRDSINQTNIEEQQVVNQQDDIDINEDADGNDEDIDMQSNDTTASRSQLEDSLTSNMEETLSTRLQRLFNRIPLDETHNDRFTRFGTQKFFNGKQIYRYLVEECYLCLNSKDLLDFIKSERFNAPFKQGLLNILDYENPKMIDAKKSLAKQYLTELLMSVRISRNQFMSNSAQIKQDENGKNVIEIDSYIANKIQQPETLNSAFFQVGKTGSPFISIKSNNLQYEITKTNEDNLQTAANILTHIQTLLEKSNGDIPILKINKTKTRGRQNGYLKTGDGKILPINSLINFFQNQSLFSKFSESQKKLLLELGLNEKNSSIENIFQVILDKIGITTFSENPNHTASAMLYRFTSYNSQSTLRGEVILSNLKNLKEFLEKVKDSGESAHSKSFKLFKYLTRAMGSKEGENLEAFIHHNKKAFCTNTPLNYIQDLFNSFKRMTKSEWEMLKSVIEQDEFAGHFMNQSWFHSIWKDMFDVVEQNKSALDSNESFDTQIIDSMLQIPQLRTFLDFNGKDWGKINDIEYFLASLINFFNRNKQNNFQSGIGKDKLQYLYLMPTFEAKGQAFYMTGTAYNHTIEKNLDNHTQSEIAQKRASLAMQEIHRMKCSYEREIQRVEKNDNYINKNDGIDNLKLKSVKDPQTGVSVAQMQLIDFENQNEIAKDEYDLGGGRFYFIGTFNKFLPYINDLNIKNKESIEGLTKEEKKLVEWIQSYIYGGHIFNIDIVEDHQLESMFYDTADVIEQHLQKEFQQFLSDNDLIKNGRETGELFDLIVQLSGIDQLSEIKKIKSQHENLLAEIEKIKIETLATNPNIFNELKTTFTQSAGTSYIERTTENANWSDITLALAVDFSTGGETLTAQVAGSKELKYLGSKSPLENVQDKYVPVNIANKSEQECVEEIIKIIQEKQLPTQNIKLNIAGNGIYTFHQKGKFNQDELDNYVTNVIRQLQQQGVTISQIRSGGQTGIDESGIIAAQRLKIPSEVHTTANWRYIKADGNEEKNPQLFQSRFIKDHLKNNDELLEAYETFSLSDLEYQEAIIDQFKKYFYNHIYHNEQAFHLLFNDLMRLKDSNNLQKRAGMAVSTGQSYDESVEYATGTLTTCMLQDFNGNSVTPLLHNKEVDYMTNIFYTTHLAHLDSVFTNKESKQYQNAVEELKKQANHFKKQWQKIEGTDGQSVMSIAMIKKHWNMLGRATGAMNEAFDKLIKIYQMDITDSNLDAALEDYYKFVKDNFVSWDIETQKTFTAGTVDMTDIIRTTGNEEQKITWKQPMSIKTADYICLDPRAIMDPKNPNKTTFLWELNKFLLKNNIDRACYGTAVKHNQCKLLSYDTNKQHQNDQLHLKEMFKQWEKLCKENKEQYLITYPTQWTKHQLETNAHFLDNQSILGVQFQKMVTESVKEDSEYSLPNNQKISGRQLLDMIDSLYELKTNKIVDDIRSRYEINDTNLNYTEKQKEENYKLSNLLIKQLENSNEYSFYSRWGLQINEDGEFNIPLDTPSNLQFVTKLIFSLVKNNVIKQKVPGGQLVQVADIQGILKRIQQGKFSKDDISDDESLNVEFVYENNDKNGRIIGIKTLEIEAPIYIKSLLKDYLTEDGTVLSDKLIKEKPQLAKMLGYRIPTEGYCSMFSLKIKRFTNPMGGGNIKFPAAITMITGSDFDIDKIFFIVPAVDEKGNYIQPTELLNNLLNSTENITAEMGQIDNALFYLWQQVLEHQDTLVERMTPGGFKTFEHFGDVINNTEYYKNEGLKASDAYMKARNDDEGKIKRNFLNNRSVGNPDVQKAFHIRNNIGKKSVGIFANPRQVHAFLTRYNVDLIVDNNQMKSGKIQKLIIDGRNIITPNHEDDLTYITENNNRCLKFDSEFCYDEITKISNILRELLSSSVDAVKKPILDGLNINDATINLLIPLVRLGFNFEQIVLILQQPIVKKWAREYKMIELQTATVGSTYIDVVQSFISAMEVDPNATVSLDISILDTEDNSKPGSLILGLDQTAEDPEQKALLPLLLKALLMNEDLRYMNKKVKIDSSSENTWSDYFSYIKFLVDQQVFENQMENNQTQFDKHFLDIFDESKPNHSKKLVSCFNGVTSLIEDLHDKAMPNLPIQQFIKMIMKLSYYTGNRRLTDRQIRSMFYSLQAFLYQQYKKENNIVIRSMDYWLHDFPSLFAKASTMAFNHQKYSYLLNSTYGLRLKRPTVRPTNQFQSLRDLMTIGCFFKEVTEETRNDMRDDWVAMLNDNTLIAGTNKTWSEFGQELVDYVIMKNGFSVTNNSFAQLIPYNALIQLPALKSYNKTTITAQKEEAFLELFARHENIAYRPSTRSESNLKMADNVDLRELIDEGERKKLIEQSIEIPKFIMSQWQFFIRVGNTNQYRHVCQLGAAELGTEYHTNAGESKSTCKEFQIKNQNWKDPYNTVQKDATGKIIYEKPIQEGMWEMANKNFQIGIEKIKQQAKSANEDVATFLNKKFSKDFPFTLKDYFKDNVLPQLNNADMQKNKEIYNTILKEMEHILKEKNYCI